MTSAFKFLHVATDVLSLLGKERHPPPRVGLNIIVWPSNNLLSVVTVVLCVCVGGGGGGGVGMHVSPSDVLFPEQPSGGVGGMGEREDQGERIRETQPTCLVLSSQR